MDIDGIRPPRRQVRHVAQASQGTLRRRPENLQTKTAKAQKQFPLPRYVAPVRPERIVRRTRRRLIIASAVTVVCLVFAMGGFLAWRAYANVHKVFHGNSTVATLASKKVTPDLLKGEGDGRVNILLLGVGGPGHDGADLTDTIVLLSVDPVNNTAAMLSVPRDLWVKMPVNYFGSQQKINAAYESAKYKTLGKVDASNENTAAVEAGFASIDKVLGDVLDVKINYHVLVNFHAFKQGVDTVGGITVNVPTELYDPTMAWENHNSPILAQAGVQEMNGVKALLYARSRETSSDFARSQRQRQILVALKDKILTAGTLSNPAKIEGLMNTFGDNVYSDLSVSGAGRLLSIMKNISDSKVTSLGLTDPPHKLVTTDHIGSTSVVRPVAGFNNYADIQTYVHSQLPDGYLLKEKAPITVIGLTATGAAATATNLKNYGYQVAGSSTTKQTILAPAIIDLSHGTAPFTLHYLQNRFKVEASNKLLSGVDVPLGSAKFVILVNH